MNISGIVIEIAHTTTDGGYVATISAPSGDLGTVKATPVIGKRGTHHGTTYVAKDTYGHMQGVSGTIEQAAEVLLNHSLIAGSAIAET